MAVPYVSASFKAPSLEEERRASESRLREMERRLQLANRKMDVLENMFRTRQDAEQEIMWC